MLVGRISQYLLHLHMTWVQSYITYVLNKDLSLSVWYLVFGPSHD